MGRTPLFHYLHLRTFCHETEDPEKVRASLRHVASGAREVPIHEEPLEGSHGNRILVMEAQVKSAAAERALFEGIARDDARAFDRLESELPRRIDEHLNLFLRLDKQAAYEGRYLVTAGDDAVTVRGKVRSFPGGGDPAARALDDVRAFLAKVRRSESMIGQ